MGMVERVARAMWNQRRLGDGDECAAFDGSRLKGTSWRDFEGLARAAIKAMREPNEAMFEAMLEGGSRGNLRDALAYGIDVALRD